MHVTHRVTPGYMLITRGLFVPRRGTTRRVSGLGARGITLGLVLLLGSACAGVAQQGAHPTFNRADVGSSPAASTRPSTPLPVIRIERGTHTPSPVPTLTVLSNEHPPLLTPEQWQVIRSTFPAGQEWIAAKTGWCESGMNPSARVLDTNGYLSEGAWQVQSIWFGPVPKTLRGQAAQVARIVSKHGWSPFVGSAGCSEWPS